MRTMVACTILILLCSGCAGRKSSLLLERNARGPIEDALNVAGRFEWHLEPVKQAQTKGSIDILIEHASREYLNEFFGRVEVFGGYAGRNPYYLENLVFYVKIANQRDDKIFVDPVRFVIVDDRGNQYSAIGIDHVTAFGEYRQPLATATRGVLESARPGYFGISFPVGKMVSSKPQGQFALLKQSALQSGYYESGVVHDGLVAFWNPSVDASKLRLVISDIKADFNAKDLPETSLTFPFEFEATKP